MKYLIVIFLIINTLSASNKIALLIGNTDYPFQPLSNPINDVRGIKKTLIEIGFKEENVMILENASKDKMLKTLKLFRKKARKAEIAFVYFSGHGMQVNNRNYLFPANTTAIEEKDLKDLIDLKFLIESTTSAKYGIILLDACRTNPLIKYFQNKQYSPKTNSTSKGKKGLGQVNTQKIKGSFIIGFATSAGNTADDGRENNSPYAKALKTNLKLNLDIRKVLGEVGKEVQKEYPLQNPIVKFTLGKEDVCLTGKCREKEAQKIHIENIYGGANFGTGKIINNN